MGTISQLLKYKKEITLRHPRTDAELAKVWIRILGDEDIKEAYKWSRKASAAYRALLQDKTSLEYELEVNSLKDQDDKDLYELIVAAKVNDFTRESAAIIAREELPKLSDVAVEPDAPSLKEQENLDKEEEDTEQRFTDSIKKYVDERRVSFEAELSKANHSKLVKLAEEQIIEMAPTQAFLEELQNQRGYRATFTDNTFTEKAFDSVEDFKNTDTNIKRQILEAYQELEMGPDEIKN